MPLPPVPAIAVVGATGAVGRELVALVAERRLPHARLRLLASPRSAGVPIETAGGSATVAVLDEGSFDGIDLAFFSAGSEVSRRCVPGAVAAGALVIDNTSAFRLDVSVPLIVPEINAAALAEQPGARVIANPNCSTIIALMAATPLHHAAGVRRMVVSTYQAVSGAGARALAELDEQVRAFASGRPEGDAGRGRRYLFNVSSHDSPVGPEGYTAEEMKLVHETRKLWDDSEVRITATCIRVPVRRAHSAAINLTFASPLAADEARARLERAPGVRVVDDRAAGAFPEPLDAAGLDEVLVGRIRGDVSQAPGMGLDLFVSGDQLRKGAALNAIQIAEHVIGARSEAVERTGRGQSTTVTR